MPARALIRVNNFRQLEATLSLYFSLEHPPSRAIIFSSAATILMAPWILETLVVSPTPFHIPEGISTGLFTFNRHTIDIRAGVNCLDKSHAKRFPAIALTKGFSTCSTRDVCSGFFPCQQSFSLESRDLDRLAHSSWSPERTEVKFPPPYFL